MTPYRLLALTTLCVLLLPAVASAEDEAKQDAPAAFELTAKGAEPRTVLRYGPTAGTKYTVAMRLEMGMESAMGSMALPTVVIDAELEILRVAENKDFTTRLHLKDLKTEGADTSGMGAMVLGSLGEMKGVKFETRFSCRGEAVEPSSSDKTFSDPMAKQLFDAVKESAQSMSIPLPKDAVGVGAKWTTRAKHTASEIKTTKETTYEVVKIEGDRIELRFAVKQSAEKQKINHPLAGAMEIKAFKGEGTGTSTLDLGVGGANKSSLSMTIDVTMAMDVGMGGPTDMEQRQTMVSKMSLTPMPATTGAAKEEGPKK